MGFRDLSASGLLGVYMVQALSFWVRLHGSALFAGATSSQASRTWAMLQWLREFRLTVHVPPKKGTVGAQVYRHELHGPAG